MRRILVAALPALKRALPLSRSNGVLAAAMSWVALVLVAQPPGMAQSVTRYETSPGWRTAPPRPETRPPAAPPAPAIARQELELRPVEDAGEKIEAGRESIRDGRIATERISDIMVRLRPHTRTFRSTSASVERSPTLVGVLVNVVINGRISQASAAQCDRFDGDVLVCTVECDGGSFGLRRGPGAGEHVLLVGFNSGDRTAGVADAPARGGFKLGACAHEGPAAGLVVMPRGGRPSSEIRLTELR